MSGVYLTDTYPHPNKDLLIVGPGDTDRRDMGKYPPHNEGPVHTRCDLHPRWSTKGDYVLFDSTHEIGRAIYGILAPELE